MRNTLKYDSIMYWNYNYSENKYHLICGSIDAEYDWILNWYLKNICLEC